MYLLEIEFSCVDSCRSGNLSVLSAVYELRHIESSGIPILDLDEFHFLKVGDPKAADRKVKL